VRAIEVAAVGFGPFLEEVTIQLQGRGLVLLEGRNHDSTSARSNGSGKTSVIKAITWCMFGQFVDGDKGVEVIHKRATKAQVRMTWIDEDTDTAYCITRMQSKRGQQLDLEMTSRDQWVLIKGKDKAATQAKIEAILGSDYDTWCNTVLFAAGNLTRYASRDTTDAQRKSMLKQIYGLGVIDEARELVVKEARGVRTRVDDATRVVAYHKAQLDTIDLKALRGRRDTFEAERLNDIATLEWTIGDLKHKSKELGVDIELLTRLKANIAKTRENLAVALDAFQKETSIVGSASSSLNTGEDPYRQMREQLREDYADLAVVQRQLLALQADRCPTCSTSLTDDTPAHTFKAGLVEKQVALNESAIKAQECIKNYDEKQQAKRAALREHLDKVKQLEQEVATLRRNESLEAKRIAVMETAPSNPYPGLIAADQVRIELLKEKTNPFDNLIVDAKERQDKLQEDMTRDTQVLNEVQTELSYLDFWNETFSDRGLIAFVIDQMLPVLNRKLNEKLQLLSDGDIMVIFDSESTLKSGEVRDKVGMRSMIEGIENATPSTAQDRKICLAGALAMMDVVASRANRTIDLQMLDEPFDGLDEVGKQRLLDLLKEQQANKSTILVTTHDAMAAGAFTHRILVERRGGVAKLVEE
jgi:DNA repair exonuclease SbcCD ATPase subunit